MMLIWSVAAGVAYAASTTIGNALGSCDQAAVRTHMGLAVINALAESTAIALLTYLARYHIVSIFTQDQVSLDLPKFHSFAKLLSRVNDPNQQTPRL